MPEPKKKINQGPMVNEQGKKREYRDQESEGVGQMPDPDAMEDNEANQKETLLSDYDLDEK